MKDQFIIAYLPDFSHTEVVLSHALNLAHMLSKGLILLHNQDPRHPRSEEDPEPRLKALQQHCSGTVPVSYLSLQSPTPLIIEAVPVKFNGVAIVAAVDPLAPRRSPYHPKEVLRSFKDCKTAYLTVQAEASSESYPDIAFTIDHHRESKEKLVWSSYFARFGQSRLHVLYHDYSDEGLRQRWYNNMLFLNKFFANLNLTFLPLIVSGRSASPDLNALPTIQQNGYSLLVTVTTKEKDLGDTIFGAPETKIIQNPFQIPVLFINPRTDLYVLCD